MRDVAPRGLEISIYGGLPELPAFNPDRDQHPPHPSVTDLRRKLATSSGVPFCTPEYAGSLPGSLKNLLDWTVGSGELYGKPVAWINVAPEGRGTGADEAMVTVLGYVGAEIIAEACVRVPLPRDAVAPEGVVRDPELRSDLRTSSQRSRRDCVPRRKHEPAWTALVLYGHKSGV